MHILATDLDGTFLGGSDASRRRLIAHFLEQPSHQLIYVTGRSVNSVEQLIQAGRLPRPDGMICDVGTTVACAQGQPLPGPAHDAVAAAWQDAGARVRAALDGHPGLHLQEDFGPRRVSYHFDASADLGAAARVVRELGLEPLVSDNLYFDVLPPGVNKGTTLQRWLAQHDHGIDAALAAGDTLNDLALLESGARAVVVGNAEPGLLDRLRENPRLYRAHGHGCDGIVEACAHFGIDLE
ncbi:MAG: HAD family hydrolase [Oceanococcaceae bacterium]